MINIGRIALSNNFKQPQGFIVHRKIGSWVNGRFEQTETAFTVQGTVNNANPKELFQFPEGDRVAGMMVFYSPQELYETHVYQPSDTNAPGTSDELEWHGDRYKILNINDWSDYGYFKAYAVYMEGD